MLLGLHYDITWVKVLNIKKYKNNLHYILYILYNVDGKFKMEEQKQNTTIYTNCALAVVCSQNTVTYYKTIIFSFLFLEGGGEGTFNA